MADSGGHEVEHEPASEDEIVEVAPPPNAKPAAAKSTNKKYVGGLSTLYCAHTIDQALPTSKLCQRQRQQTST